MSEVAVVLAMRESARLLIVRGSTGEVRAAPVDLRVGVGHPNYGDPAVAVTMDPGFPERSLLLVGLPYADSRLGAVIALDLFTNEQRYVIEGDGQQAFGSSISSGPDWDGDGWLDYAVVAAGKSGEEGQMLSRGFVSVRSGRTGAKLIDVGSSAKKIGTTFALRRAGDGRHDLLVASWFSRPLDGTVREVGPEDPFTGGTVLTAYAIPTGEKSWESRLDCSECARVITQARGSSATEGGPLLLGVPYRGCRNDSGTWVQQPGQVLVVSPANGQLQRAFQGTGAGDGFGRSVVGLPDLTGDGVSEIAVGVAQGVRIDAQDASALRILDGASGVPLARAGHDSPDEVWGALLVSTSGLSPSPTLVTSVATSGSVQLRGLRVERAPTAEPGLTR